MDNLSLADSVFTLYTGIFRPSSATLNVTLAAGGDGGDTNPIISALTLEAVPEPATLGILGLGGLALLRRRAVARIGR